MDTLDQRRAEMAARPGAEPPEAAARDPQRAARWLDAAWDGVTDVGDRLQSVVPLLEAVDAAPAEPAIRFRVLESVRPAILSQTGTVFNQAAHSLPPYDAGLARALRVADVVLQRLCEANQRIFASLEDAAAPHRIIEKAADRLRTVLPLARALDAQSRRLAGLQLARVVVDEDGWGVLAGLGLAARESTFLDVNLRDPVCILRPCNARALFVYPLLLRLAALHEQGADQVAAIDWLARRFAHRVGFRVDEGARRPNPHGPSLRLQDGRRIRLDTHRLQASLAGDDQEWSRESTTRSDAPSLAPQAWPPLLDHLRTCWSAGWRRPRPVPAGRRRLLMVCGWPRGEALAGRPYDWGRYTGDRVVGRTQVATAGALEFMADAEPVVWTALDERCLWIERTPNREAVPSGGLVITLPQQVPAPRLTGADRQADAPMALRLARVLHAEHDLASGGHRLVVRPLPGEAVPAGLGADGNAHHVQAFLLRGREGEADALGLVVRKGRLSAGARVIVALEQADMTVRTESRRETGADYEWWQVVRLGSD